MPRKKVKSLDSSCILHVKIINGKNERSLSNELNDFDVEAEHILQWK